MKKKKQGPSFREMVRKIHLARKDQLAPEDVEANVIGSEREHAVLGACEMLKAHGWWIHGFVPTGKFSPDDWKGIDLHLTVVTSSGYEDFTLSVTGPRWIAEHHERHPENPDILVDLDTYGRRTPHQTIEAQILLSVIFERLRRGGRISDFTVKSEGRLNGSMRCLVYEVQTTRGIRKEIRIFAPGRSDLNWKLQFPTGTVKMYLKRPIPFHELEERIGCHVIRL